MAAVRWILGRLILLLNALIPVGSVKRSPEAQAIVDQATASLVLYQFEACPFCVKVRRGMKRLRLKIETRDAKRCQQAHEELLQGGGKVKVPCLRIEKENGEVRWMYESSDIISYLEQRFAPGQETVAQCRAASR
ncbi:glutathione S-transferase N-terminal domain-containing protein [Kistimonas asteriae]|uniref:glutathione S-transferase N-terminal domain-containing protein n=1 Tax=Kistimonas asteriae TaxID=517724 RepID=UPI001BAC093D|nr:glutathione S-transferase N-terminal domain-containing protein [Kistimonas asteriae]